MWTKIKSSPTGCVLSPPVPWVQWQTPWERWSDWRSDGTAGLGGEVDELQRCPHSDSSGWPVYVYVCVCTCEYKTQPRPTYLNTIKYCGIYVDVHVRTCIICNTFLSCTLLPLACPLLLVSQQSLSAQLTDYTIETNVQTCVQVLGECRALRGERKRANSVRIV